MKITDQNKGNLYILLTAILWSTGGILLKWTPGNAVLINGARSFVAFAFLCFYRKGKKIRVNRIICLAAVCMCMTNLLFVLANKLTTAANTIVLQDSAPIFVMTWDSIYRKKLPKKNQILVMLMAFGGIVLFFFDQLDGGHLLGNLIAICAGMTFSGVFFLNSLPDSGSEDSSVLAFFLATLLAVPFFRDAILWDGKAVLAILALGIFQVGLAYVFFAKGSRLTTPVSASLISLMEAVLNPIWVRIFYGEKMGKYALIGAVIILFSVVLNVLYSSGEENVQKKKLFKRQAEIICSKSEKKKGSQMEDSYNNREMRI